MTRSLITFVITSLLTLAAITTAHASGDFKVDSARFILDGKPFVIKAAELHYPRIPRPYWDHRIKLCKALGMNTICLYVFWNIHERQPDEFDFSGQNDLREFIRLCDENGLKVILRPGPYVCAEWEMGGLPWWLLKKKEIRLRELDPYFMERVDKFQKAVAAQVGDLISSQGGPIIMIQVENEYGSYGKDKPYISAIRDLLRKNFSNDIVMFQCDWSSNFQDNGLDDLLWTINFGTGADIDQQFKPLIKVRPESPLMCSEFWSGWFDKWGANHETRPADDMIAGIDEMLSKGISFSLYMTHGGTNWGHWAGANSPGYAPDVTSYDYDAPISESGLTTPKYHKLRETLKKYSDKKLPSIPQPPVETGNISKFRLTEVAPLFSNLPKSISDSIINPMEHYDQGYGSILYRTSLPNLVSGTLLSINDPHDYAQVFINGKFIGKLDRRNGERHLMLPECHKGAILDILVEAMGRINFGRAIKDFKGITDNVVLTEKRDGHIFTCDLKDWEIFNLHDDYYHYSSLNYKPLTDIQSTDGRLPRGAYRGKFHLDKPKDTFLYFESWGKGVVYVNGHALGRIWEIGPQQTLYMPGCWLNKGENEIIVFDITGPHSTDIEGLKLPVINRVKQTEDKISQRLDSINLTNMTPDLSGTFRPGNGWQEVLFDKTVNGRYVCIEAINAIDGEDIASIAELHILNSDRQRISRERWTVAYADSEDTVNGNHSGDKVFDLQESTYWNTMTGLPYPHTLLIDLGDLVSVSGIQYLPRMENTVPGAIRDFRIYVTDTTLPMSVR